MAKNQVIIFKAKDTATGKIREVSTSMNKLNKVMEKAGKTTDRANRKMKKSGNIFRSVGKAATSLRGILLALGAAYVVASGIRILRDLNATAASFEILRVKLDNLMGSARKGQEAFKFITEFAQKTPLSVRELTDAFVKMKAFGLDPMDGSMQAIVDQTAKISGGQKEMGNIILAVGQMWTEQKVRGQEVRQLMQQAVPVYKILSDQMGKTAAEVKKLGEEGKLGADAVRDLIKGMGKAATGAALVQMTKFKGLWTNLVDQIELGKNEFASAEGGLLDFSKSITSVSTETLKVLRETGDLRRMGQGIGESLIAGTRVGVEAIINLLVWLDELRGSLTLAAASWDKVSLSIAEASNLMGFQEDRIKMFKERIKSLEFEAGDFFLSAEKKRELLEGSDAFFNKLEKRFEKFRKETQKQQELDSSFEKNKIITEKQPLQDDILSTPLGINDPGFLEEQKGHFIAQEAQREHEEKMFFIRTTAFNKVRELLAAQRTEEEEKEGEHQERLGAIIANNELMRQKVVKEAEEEKTRLRKQSFQTATDLANAFFIFSGSRSKALFNITKAANIAGAITDTFAAATKALKEGGPFAGPALAASITAAGLANVARISATKLGGGASGGGGSSGTASPSVSVPTGFPSQQQAQGATINLTINATDSKSFLDNVEEVLEPIVERISDHVGSGGGSGSSPFSLNVVRA